jgi:hypothetical protein
MSTLKSRLLPGCLGSGMLLALLLVGCRVPAAGTTGSASATSSPSASGQPTPTSSPSSTPAAKPQLACVLETAVQPIDSVKETLHCTVAHVTSSETSFEVHYTVVNNVGRQQTMPPCRGALSGGSGSCTVTFAVMVPLSQSKGTVSGATEPGRYSLGPVIPRQASGTPTGTPVPPFP